MENLNINTLAQQHGFDEARVTQAAEAQGFARLLAWLDAGYAGSMSYIENRRDAYRHPSCVLADSASMVMLVSSYKLPTQTSNKKLMAGQVRVAAYAQGNLDYHDVLHRRMKAMIAELSQQFPTARFRGVVDSAPLLEREFALQAGIGWIGKNTMLISRTWGSYFFISAILTDLKLPSDPPFTADHCGTCTRCLDACPTDALVEARKLDARKCISYLTIENRELAPLSLRAGIGDWGFGCDICQDVCPWNRKAKSSIGAVSSFAPISPTSKTEQLDLLEILQMDHEQFKQRFRKSPLWRSKLEGLQRNAIIVAGNQRLADAIELLEKFISGENVMLQLAAAWALGQIGGQQSKKLLQRRLLNCDNNALTTEIELALAQCETTATLGLNSA